MWESIYSHPEHKSFSLLIFSYTMFEIPLTFNMQSYSSSMMKNLKVVRRVLFHHVCNMSPLMLTNRQDFNCKYCITFAHCGFISNSRYAHYQMWARTISTHFCMNIIRAGSNSTIYPSYSSPVIGAFPH